MKHRLAAAAVLLALLAFWAWLMLGSMR